MLLNELLNERRIYKGEPLESGGTSRQGKASPSLKWLEKSGVFSTAETILDYGAGKYGRNSNYLREQGFKVYSYDPFNGKASADGWKNVSKKKPKKNLDVGFTAYVLNVVPLHVEKEIIHEVKRLSGTSYHITRNKDIFDTVKAALKRNDKLVVGFFEAEFATQKEMQELEAGDLSDDTIMNFCYHGVQTSRGFQRIPELEKNGFTLLKSTHNWKVYKY